MKFEFDHEKNSIDNIHHVQSCTLLSVIGYLGATADSVGGSDVERAYARRVLKYIHRQLSPVLKERDDNDE